MSEIMTAIATSPMSKILFAFLMAYLVGMFFYYCLIWPYMK